MIVIDFWSLLIIIYCRIFGGSFPSPAPYFHGITLCNLACQETSQKNLALESKYTHTYTTNKSCVWSNAEASSLYIQLFTICNFQVNDQSFLGLLYFPSFAFCSTLLCLSLLPVYCTVILFWHYLYSSKELRVF